jgi:hypothetical protein
MEIFGVLAAGPAVIVLVVLTVGHEAKDPVEGSGTGERIQRSGPV